MSSTSLCLQAEVIIKMTFCFLPSHLFLESCLNRQQSQPYWLGFMAIHHAPSVSHYCLSLFFYLLFFFPLNPTHLSSDCFLQNLFGEVLMMKVSLAAFIHNSVDSNNKSLCLSPCLSSCHPLPPCEH